MTSKYKKRIVAFVDILGFSQLIESVKSDDDEADWLLDDLEAALNEDVLGRWAKKSEYEIDEEHNIRMFSDCICATAAPTPKGFLTIVYRLACVQSAMMRRGYLLRGAIALGRHYESPTLIFSEGLVSAYNLEKSIAQYPRIVVDPFCVSKLLKNTDPFIANQFLLYDSDGYMFVHYLSGVTGGEAYIVKLIKNKLVEQQKLICEGRKKFCTDASIMRKLAWLERYHNYKVKEMGSAFSNLYVGAPETSGFRLAKPWQ